jgi:5-methylcytosine-specific restriction endonuclease McrBC GTP-binding regulatory subunit McrB
MSYLFKYIDSRLTKPADPFLKDMKGEYYTDDLGNKIPARCPKCGLPIEYRPCCEAMFFTCDNFHVIQTVHKNDIEKK